MVYLFLGEGFEEIEALTQVDYLRRAEIEIKTVGIGKKNVCGGHGIKVEADITIEEAENDFEMIILPGGLGGVKSIEESKQAINIIEKANKDGKKIAAICAAPTILAKMGILKGKKAVCYPGCENVLTENGAFAENALNVVTDNNITTAKAAGASEEFSFELIKILKGKEASEKVRKSICAR